MATQSASITDLQKSTTQPTSFPGMLKAFLPEIERALPKHLSADRMARIALTCFRNTPKLGQCEPMSVFAAVIQASQLGLEPGLTGEAHLIPYGKTCQLIPGYAGLIKLCMNSGKVDSIETHVVYENDEFSLTLGLKTEMIHKPELDGDRGKPRLVYGVAHIKDSDVPVVDFMTREQVHAIRNNSQGYKSAIQYKKDNPWINPDQEPEMWRKTMIRRITKRLPKSPEIVTALELQRLAEEGRNQKLNLEDAIKGEYTVLPEDDSEQIEQETSSPDGGVPTDKTGATFDPKSHAVDEEGNPIYNQDNTFRKKRGAAQQESSDVGGDLE